MRTTSDFFLVHRLWTRPGAWRLLAVWVVGGLLIQCSQPSSKPPQIGQRAPNFSLESLTGEQLTLKEFEQKGIVLVNFWATWCAPCKAEVPILNQIQQKYQGKGLTVVGVSVEEPKATVASFCRKHQIQYPVLLDSGGDVGKEYGLVGIPTTVIVNQQGTVLFQKTGTIDEQTISAIESMLKENRAASQTGSK